MRPQCLAMQRSMRQKIDYRKYFDAVEGIRPELKQRIVRIVARYKSYGFNQLIWYSHMLDIRHVQSCSFLHGLAVYPNAKFPIRRQNGFAAYHPVCSHCLVSCRPNARKKIAAQVHPGRWNKS